jgi:hypothetical protein
VTIQGDLLHGDQATAIPAMLARLVTLGPVEDGGVAEPIEQRPRGLAERLVFRLQGGDLFL